MMRQMMGADPSRPLPGSRAGTLPLIGGRLCLDFANTASGRGSATHLDHLVDYSALIAWARHAGALDGPAAAALLREARAHERAAEAVRQRAVALRESLHHVFAALAKRQAVAAADLARINTALAQALPHRRVVPAERGFAWGWEEEPRALERMLWPVLSSAAELLTAAELRRLKQCAGAGCGWLFLDLSKNGSRRWCEMEVCGSRAKARAYYARRRAAKNGRAQKP